MTMRADTPLPSGHGEVLCDPPYEAWAAIAQRTRERLDSADHPVAGVGLGELRAIARTEVVELASAYSASVGLPVAGGDRRDGLLAVTGHQPELFHPGVWAKYFLLQRFSDDTGARAVDLVVDSDTVGELGMRVPCAEPELRACTHTLVMGAPNVAYAQMAPPGLEAVRAFRTLVDKALATLPSPALRRHFAEYGSALASAVARASDLGEAMTLARRAYEASARTDYLELPVTRLARGEVWRRVVIALLLDAARFAEVHNDALNRFRAGRGSRSASQPFPNLSEAAGRVESPVWALVGGQRRAVSVEDRGTHRLILAGSEPLVELPADPERAAEALAASGVIIAPRAVLLTLFARLVVADLFIHGTGGARYDRVTDSIMRAYFGIEPPPYAVASMTLFLPLGAHVPDEAELLEIKERLHRLEHNPDRMLGEIAFDTPGEQAEAERLAAEKADAVAALGAPAAARRELTARIRALNSELAALLEPVALGLRERLRRAEAARGARSVLEDRAYPFCLWDAREVSDKVR